MVGNYNTYYKDFKIKSVIKTIPLLLRPPYFKKFVRRFENYIYWLVFTTLLKNF